MARPAIMDPYPGFESSLLPSLNSLDTLHSYQLALVPFHPESTADHRNRARALFQRRRMERIARKEELGVPEKRAEFNQLLRARDWLEGKAPGSKKTQDSTTQTEERLYTLDEVKERVRNVSKAAVDRALAEERAAKQNEVKRAVATALAEERMKQMLVQRQALEAALSAERQKDYASMAETVQFAVEEERQRAAAERDVSRYLHCAGRSTALKCSRNQLPAVNPTTTPQSTPPPPPPAAPTVNLLRHNNPHLQQLLPPPPLDLPPPPPPPAFDATPPGPVFDFYCQNPRAMPNELLALLHIVMCTGLDSSVTAQLVFHFLVRSGKRATPRPLAIKRSHSGSVMIAFRTEAAANQARFQLNDQTLPLVKCKINAFVRQKKTGNEFKWKDLSTEVQEEWDRSGSLPTGVWASKAPAASKGVSVSPGYHAEWQRISALKAADQSDEDEDEDDDDSGDEQGYDYVYHGQRKDDGGSDSEQDQDDGPRLPFGLPISYKAPSAPALTSSSTFQYNPMPSFAAPAYSAPSFTPSASTSVPQYPFGSTQIQSYRIHDPYTNPLIHGRPWSDLQQGDTTTTDPRKRPRIS
ncbi:hypothetical protein JCM11641_005521 [Rhodosporidiobolus odoratus]